MVLTEPGRFVKTRTLSPKLIASAKSWVTKMAVLAMGLGDAAESAKGESKFPDVPVDHWANGYINVATSQGLVVGYDTGLFMPDREINYAEAMTIFVRAMGYDVLFVSGEEMEYMHQRMAEVLDYAILKIKNRKMSSTLF